MHNRGSSAPTRARAQASASSTLIVVAELTGDKSFTHNTHGRLYFARATKFISYSWHAAFAPLAAAIRRRRPSVDDYFWIDIFNVAQLRHTEQAVEWNKADVGRFAEAIEASRAQVWLHLQPWSSPITLRRVWYAHAHKKHANVRTRVCLWPSGACLRL